MAGHPKPTSSSFLASHTHSCGFSITEQAFNADPLLPIYHLEMNLMGVVRFPPDTEKP